MLPNYPKLELLGPGALITYYNQPCPIIAGISLLPFQYPASLLRHRSSDPGMHAAAAAAAAARCTNDSGCPLFPSSQKQSRVSLVSTHTLHFMPSSSLIEETLTTFHTDNFAALKDHSRLCVSSRLSV